MSRSARGTADKPLLHGAKNRLAAKQATARR